jgi:hypothetical protein
MASNLANWDAAYSQRQRQRGLTRDASLAQNAYTTFLSQQRGSRNRVELDKRMTQGLEKLGSSYAHRGIANSGLANQGQSDYGQAWAQQQNDINDQMDQAKQNELFGNASAWNNYNTGVADDAMSKADDILATAASLKRFQPFLG